MPTAQGHRTDKPRKRTVKLTELQLRERLKAEIAILSRPLIDAALLSTAEREAIKNRVRDRLSNQSPSAWFAKTRYGESAPPRNWHNPEGKFKDEATLPGVSLMYRIGSTPHVERPMPRYMRRRQRMQGGEPMSDFDYWRHKGANARFDGRRPAQMSRDELLAVVGWMSESRNLWREGLLRKVDKRYLHCKVAKRVTGKKGPKSLRGQKWLGADEKMSRVLQPESEATP